MIAKNLGINEKGHLTFAGMDTVELAKEYGTPLYLIDKNSIVERAKEYMSAVEMYLGKGSHPCYAGKALCYTDLYRTLESIGMWIDVVSSGEFYTAKKAGFDLSRAMFHGNNKTDSDIRLALELGVGRFVCDSADEIDAVDRIAGENGVCPKILIRLTPGIDPHTHKAINTGTVDSKFGVAIETGDGEKLVLATLKKKNVELMGYHCHVGSQIFECEPFCEAAEKLLTFTADIKAETGFEAKEINLGGGMAVPYLESDPRISYTENIKAVGQHIDSLLERLSLNRPVFYLEPGRSMVADSGITLYSVGTVKCIEGYKNYVSVDGGMADNPRYALYQSPYTLINAGHANKQPDFVATVGGRCCESGDLIQENVSLYRPERNSIIAVLTTGAYNFSMSSNYNRLTRPALVTIENGKSYVSVKRQTLEDLTSLDV